MGRRSIPAARESAEMSALHPIAAATFADRRDRYGPGTNIAIV